MSKNMLNEKNYNKTLRQAEIPIYIITCHRIFDKFLNHAEHNVAITNKVYYTYVVTKGLSTLIHIFNMLTLYTKNVELIEHHCEKAIAYYIEFISQIGTEGQNYLQLNSKDAILFVYKKTIFDINSEVRKNLDLSSAETKVIQIIFNINKLNYLMREHIFKNSVANTMNIFIHEKTTIVLNRILRIRSNEIESFTSDMLHIVAMLQDVCISADAYWHVVDKTCKRLLKHAISPEAISKRINCESFQKQYTALTPSKFASWLLRQ